MGIGESVIGDIRVQGLGFRTSVPKFRVYRVQGLIFIGFWVSSFGFRDQFRCSEFRV